MRHSVSMGEQVYLTLIMSVTSMQIYVNMAGHMQYNPR